MVCPINQSLNAHLSKLDKEDERENAIEMLAQRMSSAATNAVGLVCASSPYDFSYKEMMNNTNGSDEYNEMFYKIAEKLIDSQG